MGEAVASTSTVCADADTIINPGPTGICSMGGCADAGTVVRGTRAPVIVCKA